jgi:hypothetical protein
MLQVGPLQLPWQFDHSSYVDDTMNGLLVVSRRQPRCCVIRRCRKREISRGGDCSTRGSLSCKAPRRVPRRLEGVDDDSKISPAISTRQGNRKLLGLTFSLIKIKTCCAHRNLREQLPCGGGGDLCLSRCCRFDMQEQDNSDSRFSLRSRRCRPR